MRLGRPKKAKADRLQCAPLSLVASVRARAQALAVRYGTREAVILRVAVGLGLPFVAQTLREKLRTVKKRRTNGKT